MRRDVFQAIADPTRRAIIQLIAQKPMQVNALASHFDISRPAVSKHVKVLTECGLMAVKPQGRERICHVELRRLKEVADWTAQYQAFWAGKLDALGRFLQQEQGHAARGGHEKYGPDRKQGDRQP